MDRRLHESITNVSIKYKRGKNPNSISAITNRFGEDSSKHKHGYSKTSVYEIWCKMLARCKETSKHKKYYFDRGIRVCEDWKIFENFIRDMGDRPEGMTLDRINNDGNYEKPNCRWATMKQQSLNRRTNIYFTFKGEFKNLYYFINKYGLSRRRFHTLLKKGLSFDEAGLYLEKYPEYVSNKQDFSNLKSFKESLSANK